MIQAGIQGSFVVQQYDIRIGPNSIEEKVRVVKKSKKIRGTAWYYLGLVGQIGYAIAIPLAGGAILGSFLDGKWGTYPKATLSGIGIGCIVSTVGFVHVIGDVMSLNKK